MERYKVTLTESEQAELKMIISKGSHKSQKVLNALILLNSDESAGNKRTNEQITEILPISMRKIDRVKKRFVEEGLDIDLNLSLHPSMVVG